MCIVIYKCVSKVIVHRLKAVMPWLISTQRSAFTARRDIVDNALFMAADLDVL